MATELVTRGGADTETRPPPRPAARPALSRRQKAAIVVRLLLAEGATLPLGNLPETLQAELTTQIAGMSFIDRTTLREVVEEFASELDAIGLSFPGGLEGALKVLEGAINPDLAARLRAQSGQLWDDDPWDAIAAIQASRLTAILERESSEVGAVVLSKLPIARAAEILGSLPGPDARRLTLAVSETSDIAPPIVARIGLALAAELRAEPPRAFATAAVERLGAILDVSAGPTREDVLTGLAEEDEDLAERVRRAIFTFADIPSRLERRDVPALARALDQADLIRAVAGAREPGPKATAEFLLESLPVRMADTIREGAAETGEIAAAEAEAAQIAVVRTLREMLDRGELRLAG